MSDVKTLQINMFITFELEIQSRSEMIRYYEIWSYDVKRSKNFDYKECFTDIKIVRIEL